MDKVKYLEINKTLRYILIIILGSILLTISAKIKIPFYPVPMTMQTFVVLFLGIAFGYKIGVATVALYLIEGIMGIPVFSNSPEKGVGIIYFTGPTMGYLIGFLFSAFLAGYLNLNKNIFKIFFKLIFSVSFIYIFGTPSYISRFLSSWREIKKITPSTFEFWCLTMSATDLNISLKLSNV